MVTYIMYALYTSDGNLSNINMYYKNIFWYMLLLINWSEWEKNKPKTPPKTKEALP